VKHGASITLGLATWANATMGYQQQAAIFIMVVALAADPTLLPSFA